MQIVQKFALACAAGVSTVAGIAATQPAPAPRAEAPVAAPASVQDTAAERIRQSVAATVANTSSGCATFENISVIAMPGTPREDIEAVRDRMNQWVIDHPWEGEGEGAQPHSGARFQPVDRWGGTGGRGVPVTLTYSFPGDGVSVSGGSNSIHATLNGIFGSEEVWKQIFRDEFDRWSEVTGNTYTEVSDDDATWSSAPGPFNGGSNRGDIRIVMGPIDGGSGVLAFNSFPDNGDMQLDEAENWGAGSTDRFFRNVITHEHGHGMGLAHTCPDDDDSIGTFPILMKPFIDTDFLGPQFDDRLSAQHLYGDRFEPNSSGPGSVNLPALGHSNNGLPITFEEMSLHSVNDTDLFRFENFGGTEISVFVTPVGPTYFEGPQNGGGGSGCSGNSGGTFTATEQGDLRIEVLRPNFSQVAGTVTDANPIGGSEFLGDFVLDAVDDSPEIWYVRVRAGAGGFNGNTTQMYNITITTEGGGGPGNPADISGDGCVDSTDLAILLAQWGTPNADLDGDGDTGSGDLAILLAGWTGPDC